MRKIHPITEIRNGLINHKNNIKDHLDFLNTQRKRLFIFRQLTNLKKLQSSSSKADHLNPENYLVLFLIIIFIFFLILHKTVSVL